MDLGMIIGNSIALIIMGATFFVYYKTKDRKETLVIKRENGTLYFLLGEDEHYSYDVSDFIVDKEKIDDIVQSILKKRARKLVSYVDSVQYLDGGDKVFEKVLLGIVQCKID